MSNNRVFLGGTCNNSRWREDLIEKLNHENYFNPVVNDWTEECKQREDYEKQYCDYHLYVITPKMSGVYSIAEAVDDSNKIPKGTLFCILYSDQGKIFTDGELKSLQATKSIIKNNGAMVFESLEEIAEFLNKVNL